VIAHRLGHYPQADKILVLEDGQIRESGTHAELLARAEATRGCTICSSPIRTQSPGGRSLTEPMKSGNPK